MPRSKDPRQYPPQYFEMARGCGQGGKEFTRSGLTKLEALRARGHWYAFVTSVRKHADRALRLPGSTRTELDAEYVELNEALLRTTCYLEEEHTEHERGWRIRWMNRDQSWQAKILEGLEVIEHGKPKDPLGIEAKLADSQARLLAGGARPQVAPADSEALATARRFMMARAFRRQDESGVEGLWAEYERRGLPIYPPEHVGPVPELEALVEELRGAKE